MIPRTLLIDPLHSFLDNDPLRERYEVTFEYYNARIWLVYGKAEIGPR